MKHSPISESLLLLPLDEPAHELRPDGREQRVRRTPTAPSVLNSSERYSPPEIVEAARALMGAIDLDPASSELANTVVRAGRFFDAPQDGLTMQWSGRIFLNPPPAMEGRFVDKLLEHRRIGQIAEAICLVQSSTESYWYQALLGVAAAAAFPRAGLRFWSAAGGAAVLERCGRHCRPRRQLDAVLPWRAAEAVQ